MLQRCIDPCQALFESREQCGSGVRERRELRVCFPSSNGRTPGSSAPTKIGQLTSQAAIPQGKRQKAPFWSSLASQLGNRRRHRTPSASRRTSCQETRDSRFTFHVWQPHSPEHRQLWPSPFVIFAHQYGQNRHLSNPEREPSKTQTGSYVLQIRSRAGLPHFGRLICAPPPRMMIRWKHRFRMKCWP